MGEVLKQITSDELNAVIAADISANAAGTEDAEHIVAWANREYPELMQFAQESVYRYFDDPDIEDPQFIHVLVMNTVIALAALCRAVEARELPQL